MKKINVQEKLKKGEWQTYDIHFAAQFDKVAFGNVVVVVAAPDHEAAVRQFSDIVNRNCNQLVALEKDGKRDIAFLNLTKAQAIVLTSGEEKECDCDGECKDGECKCQTSTEQKTE